MNYWIIIIILAAAAFRLPFMDLVEFKTDEAYMVYKMSQFFAHPVFYQYASKNSAEVHNFPLIYYTMVIISSLSRSPEVITFIIALINVSATVGFYLMVKKYYGNFVGVAAGLLLALSPWTILYSRKIWTADLIIPLTIPFLYFLHELIIGKKPKAIMGVAIFASLLAQWYATGLMLAVITVLVFLIFRIKPNFKFLLLGVAIGFIPAIPFFFYQITQNPICPDCSALINYVSSDKDFNLIFWTQPFQMINGSAMPQYLGNDNKTLLANYPYLTLINIIFMLEFILFIIGMVYVVKSKKNSRFLIAYPILISLLFFLMKPNPYDYYELIATPMVILIYALSFECLAKNTKFKELGLILLGVVLTANIIYDISFLTFLNQKEDIDGVYGPTLRLTERRVATQLQNAQTEIEKSAVFFHYFIDLNPAYKDVYNDN